MKEFNTEYRIQDTGYRMARNAFTLVELLIVIGITATMSVVGVGFYVNQQKAKILENTAQEIANYLNYAQQKSVSQEQGLQWGVHFENPANGSDFYGLYSGSSYTTTTETKYLPAGIEFQIPSSNSSSNISFKKVTGVLSEGTYQNIVLKDSTGLTQSIVICYQGTISYNVDIGMCGELGGIDTTPPIVSNVTASNTSYGSYVDTPFDLTASINDEQNGVTSCEYTMNGGTNWYSATVAGVGPSYTCTKTGITSTDGTVLTLNIRATSSGGMGTGSSITRTVDAVAPTCSDNWTDNWTATSPVNITITTSNETGSGVASTKYCVDTPNTCYPSTSGTSVSVTCTSGSACTQYIRYAAWDNVNNASVIYSKRVRQDKQNPTASDNWTDNWTATTPVTVTITPSDGSGSGIQTTYYCVDTANTCTPTTVGTSASVSCASGSTCTQYVRYYTKDNVNNVSSTYSKRVRQDKQNPTASDNWTDNWTATTPVTVTITPSDGSGSGIQTTYYCVDTANTCTPTTVGTSASVSCASGSTCTQYVRYYTKDNVNNVSSTYSKRVRQDKQNPTASDNWTDNWTATSPVTVTISSSDGSGSGIFTTKYCVDTANTCDPSTGTTGTSVSVSCASGSTCTQYIRYAAWDNVNNASAIYSKRVRQDSQPPTNGTLSATPSNQQVALSWSGFSDSGSGLATSNTYKLVYQTGSSPASCSVGTQIYLGTGTSYTHTGLTNGTTYYYRVCAYDVIGNVSTGATASSTPLFLDSTPPSIGTITPSNYTYGSYVSSPFTLSATATDSDGSVTACEYTTNGGTNWYTATLSGSNPTWTCTASGITASNGSSLSLNIRAISSGGTGTGTAISKTVDSAIPTASDNWTDNWTATTPVTVTITPSDGSGSGIQTTYYCIDTANTCTPTTVGTAPSVTCAAGTNCTQYVRYYTKDNVNNVSSTYSKRVRQDKLAPTNGTLTATAGSQQVSLSWSGFSDSGSGLATSNTYKLVYQTGSSPASCSVGTQIYLGTGTSYTHTGLTNGTTYYYRVCAYDVTGNVSTGATASATPTTTTTTTTTTTIPTCSAQGGTCTTPLTCLKVGGTCISSSDCGTCCCKQGTTTTTGATAAIRQLFAAVQTNTKYYLFLSSIFK